MSVDRGAAIAAAIAERGLDALIVSNLMNVRWACGFTGTNGLCLITAEERIFLTDFRYVERAAEEVSGFDPLRGKQDLLEDLAARLPAGKVGFDDSNMSVRTHTRLAGFIEAGVELAPASGLVEDLRAIKTADELAAIRAAAALADELVSAEVALGLVGRTELEIARSLNAAMRDQGAEPSFPPIVASGPRGALPHAEPGDAVVEENVLITIDYGAELDGYCSDCTRTYATGENISELDREIYELTRQAQQASLDAVTAGADCRAVDAVARDLITAGGHGEEFGHGLGHGVGLEVHEGPRLSPAAPEGSKLVEGMVVTVEPGIYVAGSCGVRIEDLAVVTAGAPEVLSSLPKELEVVA